MKIGLDIHGVIDKDPEVFSALTEKLITAGHEVHIITGVEDGDRVRSELDEMKVFYTAFFSITSFHKKIKTPMTFKNGDPNHPMIEDYTWDVTKAQYCRREGLDLHIDDSDVYGTYFIPPHVDKTVYVRYSDAIKEFLITILS